MMVDVQKALSEASADIMRGKVGGLALVWIEKETGDTKSVYSAEDISNFELIGAIDMLKQRAFKGLITIPEDTNEEDED